MAIAVQAKTLRLADLIVDRDLTNEEVELIKQKIDALPTRVPPSEAAHHHDITFE